MNRESIVRVLIAYEDFQALLRARVTLDPFLGLLRPAFGVELDLWGFDELQSSPLLREDAAIEALAADMIVMTAQNCAELPAGVRAWFASWATKKKGNGSALVALVRQGNEAASPASALNRYLREVAETGGMNFFCETAEQPKQDLSTSSTHNFQDALQGNRYPIRPVIQIV